MPAEPMPAEPMPAEPMTGPRLGDHEFFTTLLDLDRPLLAEAARAAAADNLPEAHRLFAQDVRETLRPDRFLRIHRPFTELGEHMRPGETAAEAAERVLAGELIACGTPIRFDEAPDWFANPTFNQYAEWTWQLSRHPEWGILAQRYRETGDERFAEGFVRLFRSWVRQAVSPDPHGPVVSGNETLCWRTIETGIRMGGAWPWALHTFYRSPAFTDDDLVDFYKSVWEHGERLRNRHRTHNWLIMEMNGLAQIGLLYPQFKDAAAWKAYAFDRLVAELPAQVYPDGFQYELSTNYHQVNIRNYEWLWDICDAYGEPVPPEFSTWLERMHDANVRISRPNGRLPDLGDGRDLPLSSLLDKAVVRHPERADFRWAATGGAQGAPPEQTSTPFEYAGYYVMRTGWDEQALWVLVDGGPYGMAHQHEDKLSVLFHAYGRTLLTEGGNYAYDRSEMRRYVLSTRAHNTVRVDGQDQNRRLHFDRDRIDLAAPAGALWHSDDRIDVVSATYAEGYGPEADLSVSHQRTVVLDKVGGAGLGPYLVVVDRLHTASDRAHRYEALWHLDVEPDDAHLDGSTTRTTTADEANLTTFAAGPADLSAAIVSGQSEPEWQGWKSIKNRQQGEHVAAPTASYSWTATGPTRLVTVHYPQPAGTTCPIAEIVAEGRIEATGIQLRLTNGEVVDLDEATWPTGSTP